MFKKYVGLIRLSNYSFREHNSLILAFFPPAWRYMCACGQHGVYMTFSNLVTKRLCSLKITIFSKESFFPTFFCCFVNSWTLCVCVLQSIKVRYGSCSIRWLEHISGFPSSSAVKNPPPVRKRQETWVWSLGWEDPFKKEMATYSSMLAWEILWTEEPGGLQSIGSRKSWTQPTEWTITTLCLEHPYC